MTHRVSAELAWAGMHKLLATAMVVVDDLPSQDSLDLHESILTLLTFRPEFQTPWPAVAHQTS